MLAEIALRNLKPKSKPCKASDRDGMYVGSKSVQSSIEMLRRHGL